ASRSKVSALAHVAHQCQHCYLLLYRSVGDAWASRGLADSSADRDLDSPRVSSKHGLPNKVESSRPYRKPAKDMLWFEYPCNSCTVRHHGRLVEDEDHVQRGDGDARTHTGGGRAELAHDQVLELLVLEARQQPVLAPRGRVGDAPRESLDPAREPLGRVGHGLDGVLRRPCHLHRDPPGVQVVKGPVDDELGRGAVPERVEEGLGEDAEYPPQVVAPASSAPARGARGTPSRGSDDGTVPPEEPVEAVDLPLPPAAVGGGGGRGDVYDGVPPLDAPGAADDADPAPSLVAARQVGLADGPLEYDLEVVYRLGRRARRSLGGGVVRPLRRAQDEREAGAYPAPRPTRGDGASRPPGGRVEDGTVQYLPHERPP
ncbi:hypothetical protein THAOC_00452, partial [Thalassiosira oceanica]